MLRIRSLILSALVVLAAPIASAQAQSVFAPGENFTEEVVFKGLPIATAMAFAPGERIYLALKNGPVQIARNGSVLAAPFVDLSAEVNKATDRGLLGIAVDPDFPQKPYIYLSYVYDPPGSTPDSHDPRVLRVVRFTADAAQDYNVALPGSMKVILGKNSTLENMAPAVLAGEPNDPEKASCMTGLTMAGTPVNDCIPCDATSHTAGTLLFGPDRTLIASFGDGSSYDRPSTLSFRSLDLDAMSGRVVRVNPDTGAGVPGNPFYDSNDPFSNRSKVWHLGMRNPFRIGLNPDNGQIYSGDVGTSYYEEINVGKGAYFGWPCYEGGFLLKATQDGPADENIRQVGFKSAPTTAETCNAWYAQGQSFMTKPLFTYRHPYDSTGKDLGSSITGLAFYHGSSYPEAYHGALFYADYAQRFIRYLTFDAMGRPTRHNFAQETSALGAVQLIAGPDTNIYAVHLDLKSRTSEVRRFKYREGDNASPLVKLSASPIAGDIPLTVSFSSIGSYDPDGQPVTLRWDFGDGSPTSAALNPTHTFQSVGTFEVRLTVSENTSPFAASSDTLAIRTGVTPPIAFIDSPAPGTTFRIGQRLSFSGHATTPDGSPSELTWSLLQKHNLHEHLVGEFLGSTGSFEPTEHTDTTSYELCLRASAGEGLLDQKCVSIAPETTTYRIASVPRGALISYVDDERELIAPMTIQPILGARQTIAAAPIHAGRSFDRWLDGLKTLGRTFVVERPEKTFTAVYVNRKPIAKVTVRPTKRRDVFTLNASASRDPEGEPVSVAWRFSDGSQKLGKVVTKRFNGLGRHTGTVTVRDPLGGLARQSFEVRVRRAR